jgi:hypothetical protein
MWGEPTGRAIGWVAGVCGILQPRLSGGISAQTGVAEYRRPLPPPSDLMERPIGKFLNSRS